MELVHGNPSLIRYPKWFSDIVILSDMQVYHAWHYSLMILHSRKNKTKLDKLERPFWEYPPQ